ncbi:MAG: TonB-dependent receptor [Acidobacteria bacterium]|nr:MAG: TonB-dependent receptor [Acidobacteriota bacterium]
MRTLLLFISLFIPILNFASVFGVVKGIVHDPQHRPIATALVVLKSATSDWKSETATNDAGQFLFQTIPLGDYEVTIESPGFARRIATITVTAGDAQDLHFQLAIAKVQETVNVTGEVAAVNPSSSTTETMIGRHEILATPGADQTNSLAMITDYVPGAYMVHDQLHIRGGHQVTWAIDGVPVPNTNIAGNVGPQFDPKDIDYLEAERGGISADYGDRTYGVFNVVTRSGFERNKEAELVASYGSYNSTDDQLSFGSHTDRFAYYTSLNGNRTDLGLETPTSKVLHDRANGFGAFTSLIFNSTPSDQLRFVGSVRQDHYQVPNDTDLQAALISDREREQDAFGNFSWIHTWSPNLVLTATPFYHFNRAAFEGGPNDVPSTTVNRASNYAGGQVSVSAVYGKNNASAGIYGFGQHDNTRFGLIANDGSGNDIAARDSVSGQLEALFLQDQFKLTSWLTLNGGVRLTHFAGAISENAADPRLGMAIRLPHLNWVLRASYSRYYQAPPLSTISGPLLEFATAENLGFLPLKGERDEQHEFGLTIPIGSWTADVAYFRTGARNFFDHDVIGDSNIFFPLTIDHVRIRGLETTVRSPRVFKRVDFHLAYSHQSAEGTGGVTGGLTDFSPPPDGFFYLDHDQRDTLSTGLTTTMKWRSWLSANFTYGSGFLNGNGPDHLPSYRTFDLSLGKSFGESWSAKVSAMNLTNKRYFIDLSNTFGGSHFANPREISLQVRYRFHY